MKRICPELEAWLAEPAGGALPGGGEAEARRRRHLAECPECRAQWVVDRRLAEVLAGLPPPAPRTNLAAAVAARLATATAEEADSRRPGRPLAASLALALYWLAAAVACAEIVSRLLASGAVAANPWLPALAWLAVLAAPLIGLSILVLRSPLAGHDPGFGDATFGGT